MSDETQKLLFGVRTLIRTKYPDREDGLYSFEERVVIVEADTFEQAITLGEAEARKYASELPESWNPKFVDDVQAFEISSNPIRPGDEVWSVIRHLNMSDDEFIAYLSRGDEVRSVKIEPGSAPNDGPAAQCDDSEPTGGPPSVS